MEQTRRPLSENLEEHLPRIRRIVSRFFTHQGDIDDLTQECCVRIIEKEHLWNPEKGPVAKWINAVVRNLSIDRQKERRMSRLDHDVEAPVTGGGFSEDHIGWVLGQLASLPPRQKEILRMKYFDGLGVTAIAQELGVSQPAVSKQLSKALDTLKRRARQEGLLSFMLPWNWFADAGERFAPVLAFKAAGVAICFGVGGLTWNALHETAPAEVAAGTGGGSANLLLSGGDESGEDEIEGEEPSEIRQPESSTDDKDVAEVDTKKPKPPAWAIKIRDGLRKVVVADATAWKLKDLIGFLQKELGVTIIVDGELPVEKKALLSFRKQSGHSVLDVVTSRFHELGKPNAGWCLKNGAVYLTADIHAAGNRWIIEPEKGEVVYIEIEKPKPPAPKPVYSKAFQQKLKIQINKMYEEMSARDVLKDLEKVTGVKIVVDIDLESEKDLDLVIDMPAMNMSLAQCLDILMDRIDPDLSIRWTEKDGKVRIYRK